jgi:hypothetical protein
VYNISAVMAYHGGKLNGVNCLKLIRYFFYLKDYSFPLIMKTGAATKKILKLVTCIMIFSMMLDFAASKLRLKNGKPGDKDYQVWGKFLKKLHDLWV